MSRDIPLDGPLSDEDRQYLRFRGGWGTALETRVDAQYPPDPKAMEAFNAKERAQNPNLTAEESAVHDENAALRAEIERLRNAQAGEEPTKPDYSTWKKADLEAEVDRVNGEDSEANLSKGTIAVMADALTTYFAE